MTSQHALAWCIHRLAPFWNGRNPPRVQSSGAPQALGRQPTSPIRPRNEGHFIGCAVDRVQQHDFGVASVARNSGHIVAPLPLSCSRHQCLCAAAHFGPQGDQQVSFATWVNIEYSKATGPRKSGKSRDVPRTAPSGVIAARLAREHDAARPLGMQGDHRHSPTGIDVEVNGFAQPFPCTFALWNMPPDFRQGHCPRCAVQLCHARFSAPHASRLSLRTCPQHQVNAIQAQHDLVV